MRTALASPRTFKPSLLTALFALLTACCTLAVAQAPAAETAVETANPTNRNPARRTIPDNAPVPQDSRDSTTRPTTPAAVAPDAARDAVRPADPSRDVAPTAPSTSTPGQASSVQPAL